MKDPSMVEDYWECKNNPDQRCGECGAPELWWYKGMREKFVENRFTAGILGDSQTGGLICLASHGG